MRSHPDRPRPGAGSVRGYAQSLPERDWDLLVRLPSHVLAAALPARAGPVHVDRAFAGLAAIAAARASGGALVREVAAAIFANDDSSGGTAPAAASPLHVLVECETAGRILAQRIPSADAAEYRRWVRQVGAAASGVKPLLESYGRALAG